MTLKPGKTLDPITRAIHGWAFADEQGVRQRLNEAQIARDALPSEWRRLADSMLSPLRQCLEEHSKPAKVEDRQVYRSKAGFFFVWLRFRDYAIYNQRGELLAVFPLTDRDENNVDRPLERAKMAANAFERRFKV